MSAMENRVRVKEVKVLSDDWYVLKKTIFDFQRRDGSWQTLSRETYDRGNGATILLFNRERKTVLLTRQFRFPAFVNGSKNGMLIEACAGLLENEEAEDAIRRESEEETGYHLGSVKKLFEAYMSPGSVTEKLHFFAAEYDASSKKAKGGGDAEHGEEIEVLELDLHDAVNMNETGEVQDGKTIMLLQYAKLKGFVD
ncbi:MAG: NUDIX domain-containing protein [Verrucomicrobia bacterium]|nr:NUDIX domain-containing protein [Verrucomicrobiota bacterium]